LSDAERSTAKAAIARLVTARKRFITQSKDIQLEFLAAIAAKPAQRRVRLIFGTSDRPAKTWQGQVSNQ
jgi:hypothetical protein